MALTAIFISGNITNLSVGMTISHPLSCHVRPIRHHAHVIDEGSSDFHASVLWGRIEISLSSLGNQRGEYLGRGEGGIIKKWRRY